MRRNRKMDLLKSERTRRDWKRNLLKEDTHGSLIFYTDPPEEGNATAEFPSLSPEGTGLPPGFAKLQRTVGRK
jgi:hypothetical protein